MEAVITQSNLAGRKDSQEPDRCGRGLARALHLQSVENKEPAGPTDTLTLPLRGHAGEANSALSLTPAPERDPYAGRGAQFTRTVARPPSLSHQFHIILQYPELRAPFH